MAASSASAENLLKWISRELLGTAGKSLQSAEHEKGEKRLDKYLEEKERDSTEHLDKSTFDEYGH